MPSASRRTRDWDLAASRMAQDVRPSMEGVREDDRAKDVMDELPYTLASKEEGRDMTRREMRTHRTTRSITER